MGKGLVGFGVVSLRNVQNRSYPGGGTSNNSLYGKAPPQRGTFFRLQVQSTPFIADTVGTLS